MVQNMICFAKRRPKRRDGTEAAAEPDPFEPRPPQGADKVCLTNSFVCAFVSQFFRCEYTMHCGNRLWVDREKKERGRRTFRTH